MRRCALRKRFAGNIRERLPPPQCERFIDRSQPGVDDGVGLLQSDRRGVCELALKANRVDGVGLDVERVAPRPTSNRLSGRR